MPAPAAMLLMKTFPFEQKDPRWAYNLYHNSVRPEARTLTYAAHQNLIDAQQFKRNLLQICFPMLEKFTIQFICAECFTCLDMLFRHA